MITRKRREDIRRVTVCDSSPEILTMKTKNVRRSAFGISRVLIASLLCLTAVMLALLALGALPQHSAGGGAIKLDKNPADRPPTTSKKARATRYSGAPQQLTAVTPIRTQKLRDTAPIDPEKVVKFYHPEPMPPKLPTKSGGPAGAIQTGAGPQVSAPSPAGISFEGVGVGLAGLSPSGNPPDVKCRL